ncbi:MAG TPA: helix-turn-helix domain-containing protein [Acidobacteriota bacterium]|nr:helix-turn-helix domain-containing protein [Acidobacteriota bacterium]
MDERWLSVDEVAEYLGIKRFTVYKWVKRSGLPARKIGRLLKFKKSEIDTWVETQDAKSRKKDLTSERVIHLLEQKASEIKKFGVRRIGLFGSRARGEGKPGSDIDILVEFVHPNFDRYMELKFFLEDLFDRDVDLVLADTLKDQIKPKIMQEVQYVEGI